MSGPPFTVKALFEYSSEHDDDLNFSIGQIITVTAVEDAEWFLGEYTDESGSKREGIFPRNFVERYEPAAPPRPTRPTRAKKEPEIAPPPPPPEPVAETTAADDEEEAAPQEEPEPVVAASIHSVPPLPPTEPVAPKISSPKQAEAPASVPAAKGPPPSVGSKPSSSSFRDRIAAFNKPAAPPIAPFKPGGLGGSQGTNTFIKKPFVALPPSKNAYVPPPREPPPRAYRREEHSDISERGDREPPASESAPPPEQEDGEDQPKPTSLKERIALLQKQQLEQAARMAEAAQKKEKPKRAPKKRTESAQEVSIPTATEGTDLERTEMTETAKDHHHSLETAEDGELKRSQLASPPQPSRELVSDTNDADNSGAGDTEDAEETSTSKEDVEERPPRSSHSRKAEVAETTPEAHGAEKQEEEDEGDEGEGEDDEEVDPETKRRLELRERMAKMSGGMGMMGMFGPPGGMPGMYGQGGGIRKVKGTQESGRRSSDEPERSAPPAQAPPVPLMALPGMNIPKPERVSSPNEVEKESEELEPTPVTKLHSPEEVPDVEDVAQDDPVPRASVDRAPPLPPHERPVLPPLPTESRPAPPPVPTSHPTPVPPAPESRPAPPPPKSPMSLSPGSESDDELSSYTKAMSLNTTMSGNVAVPQSPGPVGDRSGAPPPPRRSSTYDTNSPRSPTLNLEKRFSRGPPPIPTNPPQPASPPQGRPPPPPPPGALSRQGTSDSRAIAVHQAPVTGGDSEDEVTEYDGDYDTDIAPGAKFKDALKAHERGSSFDDGTTADDVSLQSPRAPLENRPPPLPPTTPRTVPPPPPSQPPKAGRASIDAPRSAPPPIPPPKDHTADEDDDYDPYRYNAPRPGLPPPSPLPPPPAAQASSAEDYDELYDASPVHLHSQAPPPPPDRAAAPPLTPPSNDTLPTPRVRASMDVPRSQPIGRRSMDVSRPSGDLGFIASDVALSETSLWWTQPDTPPPVFRNRKDILYEIEESSSTRRSGKTRVSKDVYVLFTDYSQTIITARFDASNSSDVVLEQRHEPPPNKLRQDQLESAHAQFGARISAAISSIQNTTVADGTPHGLIQHLLSPLNDALLPVGTRAYGALVYTNLANASVQQFDEIRAGDIVSFRNARFQGHRGGLHQKYNVEVGKPDHVGVVADWDGTKKKIHAWEQGRESKKVKPESFRLGDLKSGECRVWRVMSRSWVGWETGRE